MLGKIGRYPNVVYRLCKSSNEDQGKRRKEYDMIKHKSHTPHINFIKNKNRNIIDSLSVFYV